MNSKIFTRLLLLCLFASPLLAAAEKGEDLAFRYKCMTCHGVKGVSASPSFPHLAGQSKIYILSRLQYFAQEQEPYSQMLSHAKPLTDEEMELLADYFSVQFLVK